TQDIEYEVELVEISDQTTLNTFKYLDLNGDNKISSDEAETLVKMFMKALTTDIPGVDVQSLVSFFMSLHDRDSDSHISQGEFLDSINSFTNWGKEEL
ncbi:FK506-binding protein 2A-like protein, partial [Leptotrombidium deliense]